MLKICDIKANTWEFKQLHFLSAANTLTKWFVTKWMVSVNYVLNVLVLHDPQTFLTEGFVSRHKDGLVQMVSSQRLGITNRRNQGNILWDSIVYLLWDALRKRKEKIKEGVGERIGRKKKRENVRDTKKRKMERDREREREREREWVRVCTC